VKQGGGPAVAEPKGTRETDAEPDQSTTRVSLPEVGATATEAVSRGASAFHSASRAGGPAMVLAAGLALIIGAIAMDDAALAWPGVPLTLVGGLASRVLRRE